MKKHSSVPLFLQACFLLGNRIAKARQTITDVITNISAFSFQILIQKVNDFISLIHKNEVCFFIIPKQISLAAIIL